MRRSLWKLQTEPSGYLLAQHALQPHARQEPARAPFQPASLSQTVHSRPKAYIGRNGMSFFQIKKSKMMVGYSGHICTNAPLSPDASVSGYVCYLGLSCYIGPEGPWQ